MSIVPQWKFILVNSKDLSEIGELHQARGKSLNLALNTPGSASFTYSFEGNLAADIAVISTGIMAYRRGSSDTYKLVWSGYINEINEDVNGGTMTVSAVGWFERLNKRIARQDILYKSQYDYEIIVGSGFAIPSGGVASGIIHIANKTTTASGYTIASGTVPVVSGSSPNTPTWMSAGTYEDGMRPAVATGSGAARQDVSIKQDSSFGEAIMTLVNQENGCDIYVDPSTRALNVYGTKGSVKSEVWFGYNWGPENIKEFSRSTTTNDIANYLVGRASGTTAQSINTASSSLNDFGLFEDHLDVTLKTADPEVLAFYTAAEYAFRSDPRTTPTYSVSPYPYTIGSSVPEPFTDYDIGDKVKLRAVSEPRVNVNGTFRIFGLSISISDDGNENIDSLNIYAS
jgi:hypothetical protein